MSLSNKKTRLSLLDQTSNKSLEEEDHKDVPVHFKSYSIQDRDIFCEKAKQIAYTYDDGVYEGASKVKEVNLAGLKETPKPVFLSIDLTKEEEKWFDHFT